MSFDTFREGLLELLDLRADHERAVALVRVVEEVVLVVGLGRRVVGERHHFGDDRRAVRLARLDLADHVLGHLLLRVAGGVDAAAVLGADVVALAVQRGRVVHDEEDLQHLAQRDLRRVELDLDHLGVAGAAAADLLVGRVERLAVAVARLRHRPRP